jgi:hypothetical protein
MRSKYQFQIKHSSQLDLDRIAQDLSYTHPMITVEVGKNKKVFVLVHTSVIYADKVVKYNDNVVAMVRGIKPTQLPHAYIYDVTDDLGAIDVIRGNISATKLSAWAKTSEYQGTVTVTVANINE